MALDVRVCDGVTDGVAVVVEVGLPVEVDVTVMLPVADTDAVMLGDTPTVRDDVCVAAEVGVPVCVPDVLAVAVGDAVSVGVPVDVGDAGMGHAYTYRSSRT